MPPDQVFLDELRELWNRNFVAAILFARLNYERIPAEVAAIAQRMNQNFRASQTVNDAVNAALGSLGIFGGRGSGLGPVANPEEFLFYATLGLIVAHNGNPPAAPALQAQARGVVTGQLDPFTVFDVANPQVPGGAGILRSYLALAPQIVPLVRNLALITAALAVPPEEISGLLEGAARDVNEVFGLAPTGTVSATDSATGKVEVETQPPLDLGPLTSLGGPTVLVTFDGTQFKMKLGDKHLFQLAGGNHHVEIHQSSWAKKEFGKCDTTIFVQPGQTTLLRYKAGWTIFSPSEIEVTTK